MTSVPKPRRLRADAARNRQALIDAAQRLFTERGLGVTLDEIAAEAGVNVATAYRHFANKHELARAFIEQKIDHVIAIAEQAAAVEDAWQGLVDFLEGMLEMLVENRDLHDAFMPGYSDPYLARLDERIDPIVQGILDRAKAAGVVRAEIEPGDLAVLLPMLGSVSDIESDAPSLLRRRYLELILAALRPADRPLPGRAPTPAQARAATLRGKAARAGQRFSPPPTTRP